MNMNRVWYSGSIPDCHSGDPGSIPGIRVEFLIICYESIQIQILENPK